MIILIVNLTRVINTEWEETLWDPSRLFELIQLQGSGGLRYSNHSEYDCDCDRDCEWNSNSCQRTFCVLDVHSGLEALVIPIGRRL